MHSLQDLGEALVALPPHRLADMPIEDRLREAIEMAQRITSREGRRRQLQFVGKLMRDVDAEPIRRAMELLQGTSRAATALLHQAEHWRERLLADHDALDEWMRTHPQTDRDALMACVDAATAELSRQAQGGRHYRELFRLLRQVLTDEFQRQPASAGDVR